MLNSPLVDEASCQIAEKLLAENNSLKTQVQQLYLKLLGRNATRQEMSRSRQYYNLFLQTAVTPSSPAIETNVATVAARTAPDSSTDARSEFETATDPCRTTAQFQALKLLVHSILVSNEFVFIR